ncbi:MAG: ThuA domain-containing protein [Myxococcales bacterium]
MRSTLLLLLPLLACAPVEPITPNDAGVAILEDGGSAADAGTAARSLLVFTRTAGFRHDSIPAATAAVRGIAAELGWNFATTEDPVALEAALPSTDVLLFLMTSGDVLGPSQEAAVERWVRAGGGFVGVHSAADTEYGWPFYEELVGAWFKSHPHIQTATVRVVDAAHPATAHLPASWVAADEWYDFRTDPSPRVHVLLDVDERTYTGGTMGAAHPVAWTRTIDGGRAFYTALGHAISRWSEPELVAHLRGGIAWAGR